MVKYNTELRLADFVGITEAIADSFFSDEGEYQPYYGYLNVVRIFYNECVTDSKFEGKVAHDILDVSELEDIINDDDIMKSLNEAIMVCAGEIGFKFGDAYRMAMDIISQRRKSFQGLVGAVTQIFNQLSERIPNVISDDNLNAIKTIAQKIEDGEVTADAIVEAYGKSERFNNIVNDESENNKTNKE